MTSSSEPSGDTSSSSGEPVSASNEHESTGGLESTGANDGQSDVAANSVEEAAPPMDEGLPEWEPLTPELVEDEAIRGDFVIRWAVVGLALLFGFSQIADTRTLVHIRSGEYMASHGFLPPATDVFSTLGAERRWINLPWLFDLVTAGLHGIGGGIALSIAQGLLAGIAFTLLAHAHRAGIRTWWGSICAVLALLTCYPQMTARPELITLVGLAATLYILTRAEDESSPSLLWSLVPLNWLWAQLDQRAFLGWLLLICLAVGASLRRGTALSMDASGKRSGFLWRIAAISVAVGILHPFLWESWLSPWRLYAVEYPALRQLFPRPTFTELPYYSIAHPLFWAMLDHGSIAALALIAAAVVTMFLNRERLPAGHVIAFVVFNGLGLFTTNELAAASFVNCVVAAVNGQVWYRERFGQVYSLDWRELLFSRGGRAVTVVSFFALAWLVISGRIDGPGGRRTGIGFDANLLVQMNDYAALKAESLDDHPFHFSLRQGDLLVWGGQKSFVDHRASLFTGQGELNLIELYSKTRRALQLKREGLPGSGDRSVWRATFDKYKVTHVMPRLSGPIPAPDYSTFGDLLASADLVLTDVRPTTAIFYRTDSSEEALKAYIEKHRLNFVSRAFRSPFTPNDQTREWSKPATTYDNLFSLRRPRLPAGILSAMHYVNLAGSNSTIPAPMRVACAMLAIRNATTGLKEDPQVSEGYKVLGLAYGILDRIEGGVMAEGQSEWGHMLRYYQAVAALQQAKGLDPNDAKVRWGLLTQYQKSKRSELALETIQGMRQLPEYSVETSLLSVEERQARAELNDLALTLSEAVSKIDETTAQIQERAAQQAGGVDKFQLAMVGAQNGGVRFAIKTLEDDAPYLAQNPSAKLLLGNFLIETGRVREGHELLSDVEAISARGGGAGWQDAVTNSALTNGDYSRAKRIRADQIRSSEEEVGPTNIGTLPFLTLNQYWMASDQYPMAHVASVMQRFDTVFNQNAFNRFELALIQIEDGDVAAAAKTLKQLIALDPNTPLRPLIRFYLFCLTDEMLDMKPPTREAPEEFAPLENEVAGK